MRLIDEFFNFRRFKNKHFRYRRGVYNFSQASVFCHAKNCGEFEISPYPLLSASITLPLRVFYSLPGI